MLYTCSLRHAWRLVMPLALGLLVSSPVLAQDDDACEAKLKSLAAIYGRAVDRNDPNDQFVLTIWFYEQRIKIIESSCLDSEDNRRRIVNFGNQLGRQKTDCSRTRPYEQCVARGPNSPNLANTQSGPSAAGATAGVGAAQQQGNANAAKSVAGQGISLQQLAGGAGRWPTGVEPGNLYVVKYHEEIDYPERTMLISARSKAEAEQQFERAWNTFRDERLERHKNSPGSLASERGRYKLSYRVINECAGANWGAVVYINSDHRTFHFGWSCGGRTPAEAIVKAFQACKDYAGYNCNREGSRDATPIITIAHSGAKPWVEPINKPRLGSSWPPATFQFTSLSATTYQMSASAIDYVQGPNEAIASFGKACGKKNWPRDIYACWISSRSMPCILNSPINPQDRMPMQQACIDVKLTKDGYLP